MAASNGSAEAFHLLEARHVDNLTEAVRTLNQSITQLGLATRDQAKATRELTAATLELVSVQQSAGRSPGGQLAEIQPLPTRPQAPARRKTPR